MQFKEEEQENNMVVRQDRTLKVLNRTNNCLSRKIPPRSPWGHYLVGLKGGAPSTSRAPDIPVFKCLYCVYTTDRQSKLTRHTVGCKKKQRNKVLTQNLNSGDTRKFVDFESSPGSSSKLVIELENQNYSNKNGNPFL